MILLQPPHVTLCTGARFTDTFSQIDLTGHSYLRGVLHMYGGRGGVATEDAWSAYLNKHCVPHIYRIGK